MLMMKVLFQIFGAAVFSLPALGQAPQKHQLNVNVGLSLITPTYNLDYSASTGAGIHATVLYGLNKHVATTADIGFVVLPGLKYFPSSAVVPIQLGLRYFPTPRLYVAPKVGVGIYTIIKESDAYFSYGLAAGYFFLKKFEIGLLYDAFTNNQSSFGYAGLKLAFQPL